VRLPTEGDAVEQRSDPGPVTGILTDMDGAIASSGLSCSDADQPVSSWVVAETHPKPLTISVVIPTYRRPEGLRRCLWSLTEQTRPADEIIVICRAEDDSSLSVLDEINTAGVPLLVKHPQAPGVVAAYNLGIEQTVGTIITFIDDDAVASPDWLMRIEAAFERDSAVAGVGGRDRVYVEGQRLLGRKKIVGKVQRFGRVIGNHHLGTGPVRKVDVLKGVNMSFRRSAVGDTRFDTSLLGVGAQADCELAFCLKLRRKGATLLYDPAIVVDHYPAERHDNDQRCGFSDEAQFNVAYNETISILDHLGFSARMAFLVWAILIGTRLVPGIGQMVRLPFLVERKPLRAIAISIGGRLSGWRAWRRRVLSRSPSPSFMARSS